MKVLRTRLYAKMQRQQMPSRRNAEARWARASDPRDPHYNFPQNRITDHRINYTTHRLTEVLNGDVELIDTVVSHYQPRN